MRAEEGIFFHGSPAPFFSDFYCRRFLPTLLVGGPFSAPSCGQKYIGETFPTKPVYNSIITEIRSVYN